MRPSLSSSASPAGDPPYSMEGARTFILTDDLRQSIITYCEQVIALTSASQVPSPKDEEITDCDSNPIFVNESPTLLVSSPLPAQSTTGDPPYPNQANTPMPFMANDVVELDEFGQPWMDTTVHPLNPTNLWLFYQEHYVTCCPLSNHPQFCELFGTTITTLSQRTIAKDAVLQQDCLPFTAELFHNDYPAHLKFQDVSKCQYTLSRMDPLSHDLHENRQHFAAICQDIHHDYAARREESVTMTTISQVDVPSDSNKLHPSYPREVLFASTLLLSPAPNIDKSDPTPSSDTSCDSKLLLLPSPAPNIDKFDPHSSSGDVFSASTLLLPPSPAPNIAKPTDPTISSSDMPLDSQLLLLSPSPAPNIIQQSDTPSSSCHLSSDSQLSPSPAPNIDSSSDLDVSPLISMKDDTEIILVSTSTKGLALTDDSGIWTIQILKLPSAPNFWLTISPSPHIDTVFPYWEYWEVTLLDYVDLLSNKAAHLSQGILVSILDQLKVLCSWMVRRPALTIFHRILSMILSSVLSSSLCLPHFEDWGMLASCMMHDC